MAPLFATVNEPTKGNPIHGAYVRGVLREASDKAAIEQRVTPSGLMKTYEQRTAERSSRIVSGTRRASDTTAARRSWSSPTT